MVVGPVLIVEERGPYNVIQGINKKVHVRTMEDLDFIRLTVLTSPTRGSQQRMM